MTVEIRIEAPLPRGNAPRDPAAESLGQEAFAQLVATVPLELAAWCHRRRFPRGPESRALDDEARGRLWAEIREAYTTGRHGYGRRDDQFPIHLVRR